MKAKKKLRAFLLSASNGDKWSVSRSVRSPTGKRKFGNLINRISRCVNFKNEGFKYRRTQQLYVIYFIVATCFDLIRPSSGH